MTQQWWILMLSLSFLQGALAFYKLGWLCLKSTYCIGSETASMKINLGYCQCHRHKKAPKWVSVQKLLFNLFRVRSCFNHLGWGFLLHFWRWRSCFFPLKNGFRDVACTACTLAEKVATSSDIGSTAARSLRVASLLGIHHQANQEVRCNLDVPQIRSLFLAKAKILVMQPRRIAATTLAVGVPATTHLFVGVSNPKSGYYLTL